VLSLVKRPCVCARERVCVRIGLLKSFRLGLRVALHIVMVSSLPHSVLNCVAVCCRVLHSHDITGLQRFYSHTYTKHLSLTPRHTGTAAPLLNLQAVALISMSHDTHINESCPHCTGTVTQFLVRGVQMNEWYPSNSYERVMSCRSSKWYIYMSNVMYIHE